MSILARQFGRPRGPLGRLIGRGMARGNGDFNRWFVREVRRRRSDHPERVVELGSGPGIGLQEMLRAFPEARVWGVDHSPGMLSQSRRRNLEAVQSNRLVLIEGDARSLRGIEPVDLVLAAHVLYFWRRPEFELGLIHDALRPGGALALGYQLRPSMPRFAQRNFPSAGHVLYEDDGVLAQLLAATGFARVEFAVKGPPDAPEGRLAFAQR